MSGGNEWRVMLWLDSDFESPTASAQDLEQAARDTDAGCGGLTWALSLAHHVKDLNGDLSSHANTGILRNLIDGGTQSLRLPLTIIGREVKEKRQGRIDVGNTPPQSQTGYRSKSYIADR